MLPVIVRNFFYLHLAGTARPVSDSVCYFINKIVLCHHFPPDNKGAEIGFTLLRAFVLPVNIKYHVSSIPFWQGLCYFLHGLYKKGGEIYRDKVLFIPIKVASLTLLMQFHHI